MDRGLWRLRLNWIFSWLMTPLFSVSQIGISSSFHQFVTNPTLEQIDRNSTYNQVQIEPGLGETELFYSLLIAGFEFGAIIGGLVSGFLVGIIPYWYLWVVALVTHTLGYIIYSLASQGWLVMISRLLAGYFLGAIITLSFSYFTSSSVTYVKRQNELGIETNENSQKRVRNFGFTSLIFGYSTGFLIGPGVVAISAQFPTVNQFRAIGWFNVAYGVAGLCLLVILFHGEIRFKEMKNPCRSQRISKQKHSTKLNIIGPLAIFIIASILVFSFLERTRYAIIQTMFNPIASDSFGINERFASYLFLMLAIPQFSGAIILLILQKLHFSNQAIALIGILTTITGYLLLTDFQAIPYDPCTEYSPFHHPDITADSNKSMGHMSSVNKTSLVPLSTLTNVNFSDRVSFGFFNTSIGLNLQTDDYKCKQVTKCSCTFTQPCLNIPIKADTYQKGLKPGTFLCSGKVKFCVFLIGQFQNELNVKKMESMLELAEINSIGVLPKDVYFIARNSCIEANVSGHQCHWIPSSIITKSECEDCQPICRSVSQTLTFAQFCIAMSLMVLSNALQFGAVAALLVNQSPKQYASIMIGIMTTLNVIFRTVSPLILDAIYEGLKKRMFVITLALAVLQIPFLIEIIVLYPKLAPKKDSDSKLQYSELKQEETE